LIDLDTSTTPAGRLTLVKYTYRDLYVRYRLPPLKDKYGALVCHGYHVLPVRTPRDITNRYLPREHPRRVRRNLSEQVADVILPPRFATAGQGSAVLARSRRIPLRNPKPRADTFLLDDLQVPQQDLPFPSPYGEHGVHEGLRKETEAHEKRIGAGRAELKDTLKGAPERGARVAVFMRGRCGVQWGRGVLGVEILYHPQDYNVFVGRLGNDVIPVKSYPAGKRKRKKH